LTALSFLSSRTYADNTPDGDTTTDTNFTDLDASFGPQVTVPVGPSGRVLVTVGSFVIVEEGLCEMAAELSGANTIAATSQKAWIVGGLSTGDVTWQSEGCHRSLFEGLNAGDTTFTCKYRVQGPPLFAQWTDRVLIVEAL
jgi:hypothetical protein